MAAVAGLFTHIVAAIFRAAWRVLRVLWVCRVPAISALGGGAMMILVPQAVDLFADTGLPGWRWAWFFFSLFVWAWLVHAMARRALQFDDWVPEAHRPGGLTDADRLRLRDVFRVPATWVPRLLGLFVVAAVGRAILNMRGDLAHAGGLPQAERALAWSWVLLFDTALVAAGYAIVVLFWREARARLMRRDKDPPLLNHTQSVFTLLLPAYWPELRKLLGFRVNRVLFAFALFITGVFVAAVFFPEWIPWLFPRVVFLPVLLGGGVFLFGEIASLSHRYSTPLLLIFFVIGGVLNLVLTRYNDVRWVAAVPTSSSSGPAHEIGLADAITSWKAANCTADPCQVRPIVVAAAGGASRAGFFTATLVGALLDEARLDPDLGNIRNRIFALSTVSGSSLGGAMMRAAWADAQQAGSIDAPPCRNTSPTAAYRSRAAEPEDFNRIRPDSWRDCFQQLLAGDFLSPVFVGIAYRDIFPIGGLFTSDPLDRTGLLEQAFERWYREVTGSSGACGADDNTGLCRRLGHLPPAPAPDKTPEWMPLLFINGTSVSTGRRILVSDVRVDCQQGSPAVSFFNLAYDYRELRQPTVRDPRQSRDCGAKADDPAPGAIDLRLSTAATMSARFPIISTQGVIRGLDGKIVDSIVDGGYFENDGLATAADVVRELIGRGLQPLVIQTVSEPDEINDVLHARDDKRPPMPKSGDRTLFDAYTSIGRALYATRSGQEDGHMEYLRQTLQGRPLISIGVHTIEPGTGALCRSPVKQTTTMNVVSMSWWMSQPVQAYLDAQLCAPEIDQVLICELKRKINSAGDLTGASCPQQSGTLFGH
jgi:hypothetical protein